MKPPAFGLFYVGRFHNKFKTYFFNEVLFVYWSHALITGHASKMRLFICQIHELATDRLCVLENIHKIKWKF